MRRIFFVVARPDLPGGKAICAQALLFRRFYFSCAESGMFSLLPSGSFFPSHREGL
ncbi:hypothetical protein [Flavisolibacter ginsenosidimutans]|uniref:hypothetical protein n=1 Tax=Flavisolibacter ginsenosidimutans TaxID=661481 RepID=UPI00155A3E65|nr:hypothetical protein [Flavisolibacter ginsenosidimutans]